MNVRSIRQLFSSVKSVKSVDDLCRALSFSTQASQRHCQTHNSSLSLIGLHFQYPAHFLRSSFHADQSMTFALDREIKPLAIIAYSQKQLIAIEAKFNLSLSRAGMLDDVVDALFENQKQFAPQIRAHRQVLIDFGRAKINLYPAGC